jgi:hypothetical protein
VSADLASNHNPYCNARFSLRLSQELRAPPDAVKGFSG